MKAAGRRRRRQDPQDDARHLRRHRRRRPGHLKGKIVRIAHCGYYGAFDIIATIAALEMALAELGADLTLGAGVSRAQAVFREAGVPLTPVA